MQSSFSCTPAHQINIPTPLTGEEIQAQERAGACPSSHSQQAVKLGNCPALGRGGGSHVLVCPLPLPHPLSLPPPVSEWSDSLCCPSPFRQVQLFWKILVELRSQVRLGPIKASSFFSLLLNHILFKRLQPHKSPLKQPAPCCEAGIHQLSCTGICRCHPYPPASPPPALLSRMHLMTIIFYLS